MGNECQGSKTYNKREGERASVKNKGVDKMIPLPFLKHPFRLLKSEL